MTYVNNISKSILDTKDIEATLSINETGLEITLINQSTLKENQRIIIYEIETLKQQSIEEQ